MFTFSISYAMHAHQSLKSKTNPKKYLKIKLWLAFTNRPCQTWALSLSRSLAQLYTDLFLIVL